MQSSSWMTSNNSNFPRHTSNFCSNRIYRKRKLAESDIEEKSKHKMFLTEEKLIKNMQTLSLDLSVNNNSSITENSQEDEEKYQTNNSSKKETQFELHILLKENLRKDDLQDNFINKLYDLERRKFSMQIVPYMPIHPAQLNNNNPEKEQENQTKPSSPIPVNEIKKENDDHLFKKPFLPVPYTVEEPCDNTAKRTQRMKRSYSQSIRSNNNLSIVELKDEPPICHPQTDCFIFEPSTPSVLESSSTPFNSSCLLNRPTIHITEYFDFPSSNTNDNLDMQSMALFDFDDKMDDDDDNNI